MEQDGRTAMPMSLEQWQIRLERHFKSLADFRADTEFHHIFAFEHGLDTKKIEEISSLLRIHNSSLVSG